MYAFSGCENLKEVVFAKDCLLESIKQFAFDYTALTEFTLPKSVIKVSDFGFLNHCDYLEKVVIEEGSKLTNYGGNSYCPKLKQVVFPKDLPLQELGSFAGCLSLTSLEYPETVQSIRTFWGCTLLQTIKVPTGQQRLIGEAFLNCTSLYLIELPDGLTSIGDRVFSGCYSLRSITIPASITQIEENAFETWGKDKTIYVKGHSQKPETWPDNWCGNAKVVWDA